MEFGKHPGSIKFSAEDQCLKSQNELNSGFNLTKFKVGVREIEFLDDAIFEDGIKTNSDLIQCLKQIPTPANKLGVQRLLRVFNYLSKYLPSLAERSLLLAQLNQVGYCSCVDV